jgi:hypothetical protein
MGEKCRPYGSFPASPALIAARAFAAIAAERNIVQVCQSLVRERVFWHL